MGNTIYYYHRLGFIHLLKLKGIWWTARVGQRNKEDEKGWKRKFISLSLDLTLVFLGVLATFRTLVVLVTEQMS